MFLGLSTEIYIFFFFLNIHGVVYPARVARQVGVACVPRVYAWKFSRGERWCEVVLPHFALVVGVHGRAGGALEVVCELFHVGHGADDTEAPGSVESGRDPQLYSLVPVHCAPGVGRAQPEQLRKTNSCTYLTIVAMRYP